MGNMMGFMMYNFYGINMGEYIENKYLLISDDKEMGIVIIGYLGILYLFFVLVLFISILNYLFMVLVIVVLICGIIISIVILK